MNFCSLGNQDDELWNSLLGEECDPKSITIHWLDSFSDVFEEVDSTLSKKKFL